MPARRPVKSGERHGRWTAVSDGFYEDFVQFVDCVCDCGTRRVLKAGSLRQAKRPSCGCQRRDSIAKKCRKPVAAGDRFGRLVVTGSPVYAGGSYPLVPCICDCGESCMKPQKCLRRGTTQSCGCLQRERSSWAANRDIARRANLNRLYEGANGRIWMRSSWEVAVAHRLDRDGLSWDYEPQTFLLDDRTRYTPDFLVSLGELGDLWIEVKGEYFGKSRDKVSAFRALGNALYVVGKDNFTAYSGVTPAAANKMYPASQAA
jgi:hypothetical protein